MPLKETDVKAVLSRKRPGESDVSAVLGWTGLLPGSLLVLSIFTFASS